ncbi:DUF433 domain-containing protein [soil metagenome]
MKSDGQSYKDRITIDPKILVGKPVVTGTRIPVYLILNLIANGYDFDQIIESYPNLTHEDVRAALLYAAEVLEKRLIDRPLD